MKIYVIHVKAAYDREKHMLKQFNEKNINDYKFILDGDIDDISEEKLNRLFTSKEVTATISCAYKHYLAYKEIVENNLKYALILEDDIYLENNFNSIFNKIEEEIKENNLKNYIISLEDSNLRYVKGSERRKKQYLYKNKEGRLTGAYIIDFLAAKNIIDEIEKNKCHLPIDWYHNLCSSKGIISIYWSHPTIAIQGSLMGKTKALIGTKKYGFLRICNFFLQRIYKRILYKCR